VLAHWLGSGKAPGPHTVMMRLSVGRRQSVTLLPGAARHWLPFPNGLLWMIDTSIPLGTGQRLSVWALDAPHYPLAGGAPGVQHVRCVAVAGSPSWTGERLAARLERVISVAGRPAASLKDGGSERHKAVDGWSERGLGSSVIDDLSHAVANLLKRRDETPPQFAPVLSVCSRVARRLKHPGLACLPPPKGQPTSRLMNVPRLCTWAARVLQLAPPGGAKPGST
jgi:hypothetical protein